MIFPGDLPKIKQTLSISRPTRLHVFGNFHWIKKNLFFLKSSAYYRELVVNTTSCIYIYHCHSFVFCESRIRQRLGLPLELAGNMSYDIVKKKISDANAHNASRCFVSIWSPADHVSAAYMRFKMLPLTMDEIQRYACTSTQSIVAL
jgi:hypothetical protein